MAKLYVAKLVILNPKDISSCDNKIKTYDSEKILVQKTLFGGYEEVFTKHLLYKTNALRGNYDGDNDRYPFVIAEHYIYRNLRDGQMQFVLDKNKSFPLKEAEEKDAKKYIENFETSALKRYYDQQQAEQEAGLEEQKREKQSKKEAKKLIKESKYY